MGTGIPSGVASRSPHHTGRHLTHWEALCAGPAPALPRPCSRPDLPPAPAPLWRSDDAFIQLLQVLQLANASELLQSDRLLPLLLYHIGNGSFPLDNLSAAGGKVLVPLLSPAAFNRLEASAGTSIILSRSGDMEAPFGLQLPSVDAVPTLSLPSVPVYDATSPTGKSAGATSIRSYPASNGVL